MKASRSVLLCFCLLTLTGMRDPFRPPEDRCRIAELSQWRYQGAVRKGERWTGILKDSQQKWRRVEEGQTLENGWTIVRLTAEALTLTTGKIVRRRSGGGYVRERTMKRWIAIILIALMPAAQAGKAAKVTLVVDDVPVVQVLQALAEQERQNLVVSPDVSGTLSLHLTDVPWKQALQTVVNSAGLVLRQEGNIFHVHSQAWQKEHSARQDAERLRLQANLPLENRSISLQYADAGELAKAGEKLLSAKGTIMVDKRTNRLLLRDNRAATGGAGKMGIANGSAGGAGGAGGAYRHH